MNIDSTEINFEKALKEIKEGQQFTGKGGFLTSLIKKLSEAAFEAEFDSPLARISHQVSIWFKFICNLTYFYFLNIKITFWGT